MRNRSNSDITRRRFGQLAGAVGLAALGLEAPGLDAAGLPTRATTSTTPILTRSGTRLLFNGKRRRLSGVNAYWVGLNDNVRDGSGRPVLPGHCELAQAFAGMRAMGANLVRCHTIGISAGTAKSFETSPGAFNGANLDSADYAISQAKKQNIVLMVPLTDMYNYYHGGKGVFVHWAYQQNSSGLSDVPAPEHLFDANGAEKAAGAENQFFQNSTACLRIRRLFFDYIDALMTHKNPYTGLTYADDPTIAILETGNEIYSAKDYPEWTEAVAAHLKKVAPNKLVADGSAATGLAVSDQPGLHAADVDILGAHYYAQDSGYRPAPIMTLAGQLDQDVAAAQSAGKVFVLGEYPWTRSDIDQWYAKVEGKPAIAGDMMWTFVGGTETHGGAFGSDDYALHYPYYTAREKQYAPALAHHISAVSGVPLSGTAGGS